jgi:hypothetical protein
MRFDALLTHVNLSKMSTSKPYNVGLGNQHFSLNENSPIFGTTVSPRTCQLRGKKIQMRGTCSMHMLQHRTVTRI